MKTSLSYYGGKASLVSYILPILSIGGRDCTTFVSLFTGGGAIEFAKPHHFVEIWNDKLQALTNYYQVISHPFTCRKLIKMLHGSLYSEENYQMACKMYKHYSQNPPTTAHDRVRFAWAVFWQCNATFGAQILAGFAFSSVRNQAKSFRRKITSMNFAEIVKRMSYVTVLNRDAIDVFDMFNKPNTLFYADPPYFNSDMGHYDGYTRRDFNRLLWRLSNCKHHFVLSSYDSDLLAAYVKKHGWNQLRIDKALAAGSVADRSGRIKTECVTYNFSLEPEHGTISMFQ